jgi:hypothetical protein
MTDASGWAVTFGPLEEVACALCGGTENRLVVAEGWFGENFRVVRCQRCRLIYTNPRPTLEWKKRFYNRTLNPYLEQDGRSFCYQPTDEGGRSNARLFHYLKEQVPAGGRLIDGGCSSGLMVLAARENGFEPCRLFSGGRSVCPTAAGERLATDDRGSSRGGSRRRHPHPGIRGTPELMASSGLKDPETRGSLHRDGQLPKLIGSTLLHF